MGGCSSRESPGGGWTPSKLSLSNPKGISCPTPFKVSEAASNMYKGDKKVLVIGTEQGLLECRNGKKFDSGHNPTEIFVPLAHLTHAGFTFEFATPKGTPIIIEDWARVGLKPCKLDQVVGKVEKDNQAGLEAPIHISEALKNLEAGKYIMVFFPGGHAALNVKRDSAKVEVGKILEYAHANAITTAAICHGPDVLRCAPKNTYKGYKVSGFCDKNDKTAVQFGYLPGELKEEDYPERNLTREQGCIYTNKKNDDSCTTYNELITGSSNLSAQRLGAACVAKLKAVLEEKGEEKKQ